MAAITFDYVWPVGSFRGEESSTKARRTITLGIIIVVKGSAHRKYYTITHESSGFSCGDFDKLSDAQTMAEVLGFLLDWTVPDTNRVFSEATEDFRKSVRRITKEKRR